VNPFDQTRPSPPPPDGEADEVIELTEVVDEGTPEVVLDVRPESDALASLKSAAKPQGEQPAAPQQESLDDFLASLPELPEDLDITPIASPPPKPQPQDLAQRLSDAELQEMVRRVVQETVERLARELLPQMAAEAIERELNLIKKRLTEPD
jgi:hypothetical protein